MGQPVNIGDTVRVRMHHSKPWEKEPWLVTNIFLNDYIVKKAGAVASRSLPPDNVQPWGES